MSANIESVQFSDIYNPPPSFEDMGVLSDAQTVNALSRSEWIKDSYLELINADKPELISKLPHTDQGFSLDSSQEGHNIELNVDLTIEPAQNRIKFNVSASENSVLAG